MMTTDLNANLIQRVNVGDSLTRTAARHPDRIAVIDGGRRWTYRELNAWVNRLAGGLTGLGFGRGDALALASGNSAEFLVTYYACAKLGVVCVPVESPRCPSPPGSAGRPDPRSRADAGSPSTR